ncbi:dipeptidase PepE [Pedobacter hiemivivus]|uniref:Dipeptidase PepE n=1 Tax=Pedobacter hiemivivus TaxID=2530454 RepID=A0A4U1G626_9SPHI|nr:dipeptidase PepE [Pedobacter hiemivivus]TCC97238.1 dipeptidase PepE [Pedobacter hiemivivus]TKC59227.1 dipeptidase PepE [Pedobacter hiemivivus]
MKNVILASTSSLFGEAYLEYLKSEVEILFQGISELIFVPYARPGGISHDEYTHKVAVFFEPIGIKVKGLHRFEDPAHALKNAEAIFTGGGNTFLLVKQLHEQRLMNVLKEVVENGVPYLGTSAGSNIGGLNMQNTNDMPIVYPPTFNTLGLIPFNLNAHYLDPDPNSKHNGETRETRIKEFHVFNKVPVLGLREGSWIRVKGDKITTEGMLPSRIFLPELPPYEIQPRTVCAFETRQNPL